MRSRVERDLQRGDLRALSNFAFFRNRYPPSIVVNRLCERGFLAKTGRGRPRIGGFHLVVASDDAISKIVATLKDTFKVENIAPGHCTGEPTFAALKQAFGDHYIYAGVGTSLATGLGAGAGQRRGEAPALDAEDLVSYRRLAAREDPFGLATWRRKLANTESDGAKH